MGSKNIRAVVFVAVLCLLSLPAATSGIAQAPETVKTSASVPQDSAALLPATEQKDDPYRIGYQDTVEIQVFRHPELTQRVSVNPNGTINLFRLPSPVVAVCKTIRELANDVAAAYEKDYLRNPEVNIVPVEQRSQSFAVIGAVEKPGSYMINRKVRLLELLAAAGGPSKEAGTRLIVARTGSTSNCKLPEDQSADADDLALMDFKLDDVLQAKQNLVMKPGDIVSVLKTDVVYVYGHVNKQGQVPIRQPITLTQAIASAEGLEPAAKRDTIRILRQKPGTLDREELVFNLKEIDSRKVADPYLQPNDVVAVSEDKTRSILNSIGKSLTQGIPTILYRVP